MKSTGVALFFSVLMPLACKPLVFEIADGGAPELDGAVMDGEVDADASERDAGSDVSDQDVSPPDAAPPDASGVRVRVHRGTAPAVAVAVLFHNAAGDLIVSTTTDPTGSATSADVETAMVTIVEPPLQGDDDFLLQTIAGIESGDQIDLSLQYRRVDHVVEIVPPGSVAGADRYEVDIGCSVGPLMNPDQNIQFVVSIVERCVTPMNRFVALATAYDAADEPVAYATATASVSSTSTTVIALPAWSTELTTFDLTATDAPAESLFLYVALKTIFDGLDLGDDRSVSVVSGQSRSFHFVPPDLELDRQLQIQLQFEDLSSSLLFEPLPRFSNDTRELSLAAELLPKLTLERIAWPSAHRPRIAWSSAAVATVDAAVALFFGNAASSYEWTILIPLSQTSTSPATFDLPELPESFAAARPNMALPNRIAFELSDWASTTNSQETKGRSRSLVHQSLLRGRTNERFRITLGVGD